MLPPGLRRTSDGASGREVPRKGCAGDPPVPIHRTMSSPPKTRPETWVPAGAEKDASETDRARRSSRASGASSRVAVAAAEEPRRRRRIPRLRTHATNLLWALLAAAVPWVWFLVRDLGSVTQLVALAIPVLVVAAFVGLAISALDERKLSTLVVAVSVAAFGWVTIFGPRSRAARPRPRRRRCGSRRWPSTAPTGDADAVLRFVDRTEGRPRDRSSSRRRRRATSLLRTDRYPFALSSGPVVVLSSAPVRELPLPKGLPSDLIVRLQVDRPEGAFIVYAVRTGDSLLGVDAERSARTPTGCGMRRATNGCRSCSPATSDSATVPPGTGCSTTSFRDAMRTDATRRAPRRRSRGRSCSSGPASS